MSYRSTKMENKNRKIIFVRHGKDDDNYRGGWSTLDLIEETKMEQ